jgi:hypothetical protein
VSINDRSVNQPIILPPHDEGSGVPYNKRKASPEKWMSSHQTTVNANSSSIPTVKGRMVSNQLHDVAILWPPSESSFSTICATLSPPRRSDPRRGESGIYSTYTQWNHESFDDIDEEFWNECVEFEPIDVKQFDRANGEARIEDIATSSFKDEFPFSISEEEEMQRLLLDQELNNTSKHKYPRQSSSSYKASISYGEDCLLPPLTQADLICQSSLSKDKQQVIKPMAQQQEDFFSNDNGSESEWLDIWHKLETRRADPPKSHDLAHGIATTPDAPQRSNVPSVIKPEMVLSHVVIKRPPFPNTVRNLSAVIGVSSATIIRTCFRIGELLNSNTRCLQDNQDAVYELFAKVSLSTRDDATRTQHFHFKDLFEDQLPVLTGILRGWRIGSLVDRQSRELLNRGKNTTLICRCICKIHRNNDTVLKWSLEILRIRQTDWDEIWFTTQVISPIIDQSPQTDDFEGMS